MKTRLRGLDTPARIISEISIPPIIAAIVFPILYYHTEPDTTQAITGTLVCWISSAILPILYIIRLEKRGQVSHRHIPIQEQRTRPYVVGSVCYSIGLVVLLVLNAPFAIWGLMFCYITNTLVIAVINLRWKISAHATGVTGALAGAHFAIGPIVLPFYLLLVPVCWARLRLKAHTPAQLFVGSVLGAGLTFAQLYLLGTL